jgi:uncharacterized protein involved in response to NO
VSPAQAAPQPDAPPRDGPARLDYRGPAILLLGFRPFFLAAGIWSALTVGLWLLVVAGQVESPGAFDPLTWHGHEMIFGFAVAAIAGFLSTAVPNWTGRLPIQGRRLALLCGLWLAGRLAVMASGLIGPAAAAVIDVAFLVVFAGAILREILAGPKRSNLPVVGILGLLAGANTLIHLEAIGVAETAVLGLRLAIAVVVMLITLIGGRVVPSFTRNWLAKRKAGLPAPFGRVDRLALLATALAGLAWVAAPGWAGTGLAALLAAAANGARLARWRGLSTLGEPLVFVLHLGYGWLAAGFALLGLATLTGALPASAALHALTAGAIGTMTLAVMTRATLGHTGQALRAGAGTTTIYLLVTAAAVLRVVAPLLGAGQPLVLVLGGLAWIGAFGLFVALYGPLLVAPRRAG